MTTGRCITAVCASLLAIALVALAGCGRLNRTATLNQTTQVSGATVQPILEQQLAKEGLPGATVTCAKTMIVNAGTTTSCGLSSVKSMGTVTFMFRNSSGAIALASVKPS